MPALAVFLSAVLLSAVAQAAQGPMITPAPRYPSLAQLRQRSLGLDTGGYVSGNSKSPLTCPASFTCSDIGDLGGILGCCNPVNCAPSSGAVICGDRANGQCQGDGNALGNCDAIYGSVLLCTDQTAPACVNYLRVPPSSGGTTQTSYSCATSQTTILFLLSTTDPNAPAATSGAASTNQFAGLLPSSTSQVNFPSTTQNTISSSTSSPTTSTSSNSNKPVLSTFTIIAIAVGGVAFLAIISLLIDYIRKNYPSSSRSKSRPSRLDDSSSAWAGSQWARSQYRGPQNLLTEAWVMENRSVAGAYSDHGDGSGGRGGYGGGRPGWRG